MGAPYLDRMDLHWCDECCVPLLGPDCSTCGSVGRQVKYSPPGDVRPAFERDRKGVIDSIVKQFDPETDLSGIGVMVLNKTSSLNEMEEVILGGRVAGIFRSKKEFIPRADFARLIRPRSSIVEADPGARGSLMGSSNLMAPGILSMSPGVKAGDEVIVVIEGEVIGAGKARIGEDDVGLVKRGVGVKIRHRISEDVFMLRDSSLDDAVSANEKALMRIERKGVNMVERVWTSEKPKVVSFSGGKDSLATLLVVLASGHRPEMLFVDTGLELPETIVHVKETAEKYSLDLTVLDAGDAFRKALGYFGPPAKDYRWCCKTNKLGPAAVGVMDKYPDGVVSFIGQRSYESEARARKGAQWRNPWVPGQEGISPIQHWTGLHVWLYLTWKDADVNPWYRRGMDRIGCSLCPAADETESALIAEQANLAWWEEELTRYAEDIGMPERWAVRDWRWRKPNNPEVSADEAKYETRHKEALSYQKDGSSITINNPRNEDRRLLDILEGGDYLIDPSGDVIIITGRDRTHALNLMIRGRSCVGCGICTARCPTKAIVLSDGRVELDPSKCTHCKVCLGPCPVVDFHPLKFRPRM